MYEYDQTRGNSSFGETQLSNIKQTNNCGSGGGTPPDIWADLEKEKKETACKNDGYQSCQDKAEKEKEKADKEKADKEKADKEKADKEKADKEKADKEKADGNRIEIPDSDKMEDKTNNEETKISLNKKQLIIIGVGAFVFLIILILLLSGSSSSDQIKKE